jgi:RNA polymerase sigma-70 factor, ECF subfamily
MVDCEGSLTQREEIEQSVRELLATGQVDAAVTVVIRGYGPGIHGYLLALHGGDDLVASDVFSEVAERIWKGLPKFGWRCSLHGWVYVIARNTSRRHHHRRGSRRRFETSLSPSLEEGIGEVMRTATRTFERSEGRDALTALRDALEPDDRTLLVLRLDRGLNWLELARVFLGEDGEPGAEALQRESARLRKRFQLVKERLVKRAKAAGISAGRP